MELLKNTSSVMTSGSVKQPIQEAVRYYGYFSRDGSNRNLFSTKDTSYSNESSLISVSNSGFTKYTILKKCIVNVSASYYGSAIGNISIQHFDSSDSNRLNSWDITTGGYGSAPITTLANVGDYFVLVGNGTPSAPAISNNFSITATAIESIQPNFVVNITPPTAEKNYFLEAAGNAGQAIGGNTTDIPFIASIQNNLNWLGDNFIAPIDGNYQIAGSIIFTTSIQGRVINFFVNNVNKKTVNYISQATTNVLQFSASIYLTAGQKFSVRCDTASTLNNISQYHWLTIARISGLIQQTLIGNVPKELMALAKCTTTYGAAVGTTTAQLDFLEGDDCVSLLNNQLIFNKLGRFNIEWQQVTCRYSNANEIYTRFFNVTNNIVQSVGSNCMHIVTSINTSLSIGSFMLDVNSPITLRLENVVIQNMANIGYLNGNLSTLVKIRKLA